ncbi:MAG: hypothetical protein JOY93_12575 [Acidobacteriales bacterium]|nr:hypothetical protein [Terriglobales bacterium]
MEVGPPTLRKGREVWGTRQMVEQQNGSTYTQMLYSPAGKTAIMHGQTLTKAFVNLPGGATAIYNSSGPAYYRHADWLGSSRLTSTPSRTVYSDSAYAPSGEQYAVSGTTDASFTGNNSDTNSTLYDFTFREIARARGAGFRPILPVWERPIPSTRKRGIGTPMYSTIRLATLIH